MRNKEAFEFNKSLEIGKTGEELFHKIHPHLKRTDGFKYDFIGKNNTKIELKSDYYDINKTENFFMERFSYDEKAGGPWQSLKSGSTHYVYFFVKNMTYFVFDTQTLVNALDVLTKRHHLVAVNNKLHITRGYKIPRHLLEIIYKEIKVKSPN